MNYMLDYVPPTTLKELKDFQKLNYHIECEFFKPIPIDGWEGFEISNYGRLRNIKTDTLIKCNINAFGKRNINSLYHRVSSRSINNTICDMMLHAFYPDIVNTHINPISIDGNMFNLYLDNINYVPNAYYVSLNKIKEWIWIYGEKSKYTIDVTGTIIDEDTGMVRRSKYNKGTDSVSLRYKDDMLTHTRIYFMAEAFIPNPNNLKNVVLDRSF